MQFDREVVLNMLLRLSEYPQIVVLLSYVLDCYKKSRDRWQQVCAYNATEGYMLNLGCKCVCV